MEILIQSIGVMGAIVTFVAFLMKSHGKIMVLKVIADGCFAVQWLLMTNYTAMCMSLLGVLKDVTFFVFVKKGKKTEPLIVLLSILSIVLGIITWDGILSLLAIVGNVLYVIGFGMKDVRAVKTVCLFGAVAWLTYDIFFFSLGGLLSEGFSIVSILISLVVLAKERKRDAESA